MLINDLYFQIFKCASRIVIYKWGCQVIAKLLLFLVLEYVYFTHDFYIGKLPNENVEYIVILKFFFF